MKVTWGSLQLPEPSRWRPAGGYCRIRAGFTPQDSSTDFPYGMCLSSPSSYSLSFFHQISADKKTLGRFCGQLGSPLGNPPGKKEFISEGNKMLLTFHTDFSNEENGTIMFYKGFLAYYQAVGEWAPGALFWASIILNGEWKKGILNPKKQEAWPSLFFPLKRAFSRRGMPAWVLSPVVVPRKH